MLELKEKKMKRVIKQVMDTLEFQVSHISAAVLSNFANDSSMIGLFFNYEISPLMVIHRETRQSLAHFLTSTCAIVGGVLTVAGLVDSFVYAGRNRIKNGGGALSFQSGLGAREGKFL